MSVQPGLRLVEFLNNLEGATHTSTPTAEAREAGSIWRLGGTAWEVEVIVDPSRWLGLTFNAVDPATGRKIHYAIDTDLYDISRMEQRAFVEQIENDIIEFLDNLTNGRVLRGQRRSDVLVVFPRGGSFVRLTQGRFMTRLSAHARKADAVADVAFAPFA